jgi:hypothetical protein
MCWELHRWIAASRSRDLLSAGERERLANKAMKAKRARAGSSDAGPIGKTRSRVSEDRAESHLRERSKSVGDDSGVRQASLDALVHERSNRGGEG